MTTRHQLCPVDGAEFDDHTNEDLVYCDQFITEHYGVARDFKVPTQPHLDMSKVNAEWLYTLPERYQG